MRIPWKASDIPSPTAVNRIVVSTCHYCGSAVDWLDTNRARAIGMDLASAVESLGVSSVDQLDMWICIRCEGGGILSRRALGRLESFRLLFRAAIDRLHAPLDPRHPYHGKVG